MKEKYRKIKAEKQARKQAEDNATIDRAVAAIAASGADVYIITRGKTCN